MNYFSNVTENKETGLQLLQSDRLSLLKIGTNLAILYIFDITPVMNDLFITVDKGMETVSGVSFKIFVGILWDQYYDLLT